MSQFGSFNPGTGAPPIETITGNTGGAVGPDGSGNINVVGAGNITVAGTAGTNTETITLIGTTNHAVQVGNSSGSLTSLSVGTTNTALLGATGADPIFGQVPNAALVNSSITLSNGNNVTVTGSPVALGGTATIAVSGTTNHGVQVGNAGGSLTSLAVGATNTALLGSTGADPAFGQVPNAALVSSSVTLSNGNNITVTGSPLSLGGTATIAVTGTTNHAVQLGNAGGSLSSLSVGATNTVLLGNTGADPSFGQVPTAALVSSSITLSSGNNITVSGSPVSLGGTATVAVTGTTNHAVQIGNASGSLTSVGGATNGQLLVGATSADPTWVTPTAGTGLAVTTNATTLQYALSTPVSVANGGTGAASFTAYAVICGGTTATGALQNVSGVGSSGQVLTSNGASALPTWQTITTFTWNTVSGTSQTMAVNNGYFPNNAGLVTLTLPSTAAGGDIVRVSGKGAGGWKIAQNSGQTIHFGSRDTTTGVGGSLASTNQYDAIELVCHTANTDWSLLSGPQGNLTVV
jgi:hypothetical protein